MGCDQGPGVATVSGEEDAAVVPAVEGGGVEAFGGGGDAGDGAIDEAGVALDEGFTAVHGFEDAAAIGGEVHGAAVAGVEGEPVDGHGVEFFPGGSGVGGFPEALGGAGEDEVGVLAVLRDDVGAPIVGGDTVGFGPFGAVVGAGVDAGAGGGEEAAGGGAVTEDGEDVGVVDHAFVDGVPGEAEVGGFPGKMRGAGEEGVGFAAVGFEGDDAVHFGVAGGGDEAPGCVGIGGVEDAAVGAGGEPEGFRVAGGEGEDGAAAELFDGAPGAACVVAAPEAAVFALGIFEADPEAIGLAGIDENRVEGDAGEAGEREGLPGDGRVGGAEEESVAGGGEERAGGLRVNGDDVDTAAVGADGFPGVGFGGGDGVGGRTKSQDEGMEEGPGGGVASRQLAFHHSGADTLLSRPAATDIPHMILAWIWTVFSAVEGAPAIEQKYSGKPVQVSGRVVITRPLTKRRIAVDGYAARGAAVRVESPVGAGGLEEEMDSVVIYLESRTGGGVRGPGGESPAAKTLTQKNRQFAERLVVVKAGDSVSFPNEDPIFHNVFSLSRTKSFDLGYYPKGQTRAVTFAKPGAVEVFCHLHPHMAATVLVLPGGDYTRPGRDGSFVLNGVPPGEVEIVAWHRAAGFFRRTLQAPATNVEFVLPLRER
jgi:plastocyanin